MLGTDGGSAVAWGREQIEAARLAREGGDAEKAIELLRELVQHIAGRDDATEGIALANLQLLLLQEGRPIECLLIGTRAVVLLEGAGATKQCLRAQQMLALLHARLGDWPRYDAACAEIELALLQLSDEERGQVEHANQIMMAGTSLDRGAYETCLDNLAVIEERDPSMSVWVAALRAYALASSGRAPEAREVLERLRTEEPQPAWLPIWVESTETHCSLVLDPPDAAAARAGEMLERLAEPSFGAIGNRTAMILQLAAALPKRAPFDGVARRALHIAAEGNLARLLEVERFTRSRDRSVELSAEERRVLRDLRQRLHARHAELYAAIADVVAERVTSRDDLGGCLPQRDPHIVMCAWCSCVRHEDGRWIPVGSFLPESRKVPLTHGICPACRRDLAKVG